MNNNLGTQFTETKASKLGDFSGGPVAAVQSLDTTKVCQRRPSVEKSLPALHLHLGVKQRILFAINCRISNASKVLTAGKEANKWNV